MAKPSYKVSILMNGGLTYEATGDSLREAFDNLNLSFQMIKTKGEITVRCGDKTASRLFPLPKLRRFFVSKILMSGLINNFQKLLA